MAENYYKKKIDKHEEYHCLFTDALNYAHESSFSPRFWQIILIKEIGRAIRPELTVNGRPLKISKVKRIEKLRVKSIHFAKSLLRLGTKRRYDSVLKNTNIIACSFSKSVEFGTEPEAYLPYFFPKVRAFQKEPRKRLDHYAQSLQNEFHRSAVQNISDIFVERFSAIISQVPMYNPEQKEFHLPVFNHWFINFTVAKYVEAGARFICYQHGGFYGEMAYHPDYHITQNMADQFVTWGWQLSGIDKPWFSYKLELFGRRYNHQKRRKLFNILIPLPSLDEMGRQKFSGILYTFLAEIDRIQYSNIYVRPRPTSRHRSFRKKLDFLSGDFIRGSGKNPIHEDIANSQLVFQPHHPTTNFLECVFVDHPVVVLIEDNFEITSIAQPFYEAFFKMNVFHREMKSLTDHLNSIDLHLWWKEVIASPDYQNFKNTFARSKVFHQRIEQE